MQFNGSYLPLTSLAGSLVAFAPGAAALGQSLNVDFGTASIPDDDYAAAGLAGVWNAIDPVPGSLAMLVGLDGAPLEATVVVQPNLGPPLVVDDAGTTGNDASLFDDFLPGLGDVAVILEFDGLLAGTYEVITYGWVPGYPDQGSTIYLNDGETPWNGQVIGGAWPGDLVQGVTHALHTIDITDGALQIGMFGSYWWTTGVFNGVQLRHLQYLAEDVDQDGGVGASDLVTILLNWTTPGHGCDGVAPCLGDVNDDLVVDVADLLLVIQAWTG